MRGYDTEKEAHGICAPDPTSQLRHALPRRPTAPLAPPYLGGDGAEHVVLLVGQRLGRRNHNRLARVNAQRVKVLHVAHGDGVVAVVAHNLVLNLLPALERALQHHLA